MFRGIGRLACAKEHTFTSRNNINIQLVGFNLILGFIVKCTSRQMPGLVLTRSHNGYKEIKGGVNVFPDFELSLYTKDQMV